MWQMLLRANGHKSPKFVCFIHKIFKFYPFYNFIFLAYGCLSCKLQYDHLDSNIEVLSTFFKKIAKFIVLKFFTRTHVY